MLNVLLFNLGGMLFGDFIICGKWKVMLIHLLGGWGIRKLIFLISIMCLLAYDSYFCFGDRVKLFKLWVVNGIKNKGCSAKVGDWVWYGWVRGCTRTGMAMNVFARVLVLQNAEKSEEKQFTSTKNTDFHGFSEHEITDYIEKRTIHNLL